MEASDDPVATHWRLDKRIPIALVVVLVGQFAAGVAAFTKVQTDVSFIREHVTDLRVRVQALNDKATEIESIKVQQKFQNESINRIRNTLDRLVEDRFINRRRESTGESSSQ